MKKIKEFLLYSGLSKKSFYEVKPYVTEENRTSLLLFSSLSFLSFLVIFIISLMHHTGVGLVASSVVTIISLIIVILSATVCKKKSSLCDALCYIYTALILALGVYTGVRQTDQRTTILLAFYMFSAMVFCERLIVYLLIIFISQATYLVLVIMFHDETVLLANIMNTTLFAIAGFVAGLFLMKMKYNKHEINYMNIYLLERDTLTGVYNRHSYDIELERVKRAKDPIAICAFDVNGLKPVNDTYGHPAGDELIIGAASCINKVFGKNGKVFRTGGDEFFAIITTNIDQTEALVKEFHEVLNKWDGEYSHEISISCGISFLRNDYEGMLLDALKEADRLMYEDKKKYYESRGITKR